jgi:hypothetical protein
MNTPHEGGEVFQVQAIQALEPRLPKQGTKQHAYNINSEIDR